MSNKPAVIVLEVAFLTVFWLWVFAAVLFLRNTVLEPLAVTTTPQTYNLQSQTVHFKASDGVSLEGWLIGSDFSRPWIIGCHGLGSNRADLLDIASGLNQAGFNVFLFDFRAHGGSSGRTTSFGLTEQRDLEGALVFLGAQPEIAAKAYGIYGISMGGSVALMVAARDERLGAIAVDSPYTDLDASLAIHQRLLYPWLPLQPFLSFIQTTYRLRFGAWPKSVSPQQSASKLGSRHLLVIGGTHDPRMPAEGLRQIAKEANSNAELWLIDGADHLGGYASDPQAYTQRLTKFFNTHL